VRLAPHPRYRVAGHDLECDLPVTPWEAALGTRAKVATLDGDVMLTVPAGTQSGARLRLRGKGMPRGIRRSKPAGGGDGSGRSGGNGGTNGKSGNGKRGNGKRGNGKRGNVSASDRGDLYVVVKIVVPQQLTDRERELFEELAKTSRFDPR
jgi:curved DNA-binding protein